MGKISTIIGNGITAGSALAMILSYAKNSQKTVDFSP